MDRTTDTKYILLMWLLAMFITVVLAGCDDDSVSTAPEEEPGRYAAIRILCGKDMEDLNYITTGVYVSIGEDIVTDADVRLGPLSIPFVPNRQQYFLGDLPDSLRGRTLTVSVFSPTWGTDTTEVYVPGFGFVEMGEPDSVYFTGDPIPIRITGYGETATDFLVRIYPKSSRYLYNTSISTRDTLLQWSAHRYPGDTLCVDVKSWYYSRFRSPSTIQTYVSYSSTDRFAFEDLMGPYPGLNSNLAGDSPPENTFGRIQAR